MIVNAPFRIAIVRLGYFGGHSYQSAVRDGGQRVNVVEIIIRMLNNISDVNLDIDFGCHI